MKVLLVAFSDNADHQDITFGMFESLYKAERFNCEVWVMGINTPKSLCDEHAENAPCGLSETAWNREKDS